jgi:hypothetical protein
MQDFTVKFDRTSFKALDNFVSLASQDYNFGNNANWFLEFRGGLFGFFARLNGVEHHYFDLHAWLPRIPDFDYELATLFFHMDSALECLTYALNAFGWAVSPHEFRDPTVASDLRKICPRDIVGDRSVSPLAGYSALFPKLKSTWTNESCLVERIRDLHDVSKHRRTIFTGGLARMDAPPGFFESLRVPDVPGRALLWPMAEIILEHDPKSPTAHRTPQPIEERELLEDLVPAFARFIETSGTAVLDDAQKNVVLKEVEFRTEPVAAEEGVAGEKEHVRRIRASVEPRA